MISTRTRNENEQSTASEAGGNAERHADQTTSKGVRKILAESRRELPAQSRARWPTGSRSASTTAWIGCSRAATAMRIPAPDSRTGTEQRRRECHRQVIAGGLQDRSGHRQNIGQFSPRSLGQYFSPDSGLVYNSDNGVETIPLPPTDTSCPHRLLWSWSASPDREPVVVLDRNSISLLRVKEV